MEGEWSTERESEEDSIGETESTKRRRMTSAVEESLKKRLLLLPPPVVLGERRCRVWVTSATVFSENDESMMVIVEEWRLPEAPVARCRFLGPPIVILSMKLNIQRGPKGKKDSEEKSLREMDRAEDISVLRFRVKIREIDSRKDER